MPGVKTLTFDNGKEFAAHAHIDEQLQSTTYFAKPFGSLDPGSYEKFNGLLQLIHPQEMKHVCGALMNN